MQSFFCGSKIFGKNISKDKKKYARSKFGKSEMRTECTEKCGKLFLCRGESRYSYSSIKLICCFVSLKIPSD